MSRLPLLILAAACAVCAAPALAAPLNITVPGDPFVYDTLPDIPTYNYNLGGDPWAGGNFNAATAAQNSLIAVPWANRHYQSPYSNLAMAVELVRKGESFGDHWMRCEARYASYSVVGDTYRDNHGVPHACLL